MALLEKINENMSNSNILLLATIFPFLRYVPWDPFGIKHTIHNVNDAGKHLTLVINEHEETFDENNLRDNIDIYLKRMKSEKGKTESTFHCKFMVTMCMGFHILYNIRSIS